jgi:hypothetical protein
MQEDGSGGMLASQVNVNVRYVLGNANANANASRGRQLPGWGRFARRC